MKKLLVLLMCLFVLFGCSKEDDVEIEDNTNQVVEDSSTKQEVEVKEEIASVESDVDVDLTKLSSTMVYAEVYNMVNTPEEYIGKTVRMNGQYVQFTNSDQTMFYPAIIIQDATACCAQGIEFVLKANQQYPQEDSIVTVVGTFESYLEDGYTYYHLVDSYLD